MQVKVTCPKCGNDFAEAPKRVLREIKCPKCGHGFVPASEGVACPSCGSVLILPPGSSRREVVCLKCSFAFRRRRWWQKRKYQVALVLLGVIVFLGVCMVLRARSNLALARELRADFKRWLATLPQVPDTENGMPVVLDGVNALVGSLKIGGLTVLSAEDEENRDAIVMLLDTGKLEGALGRIYEGLKYEKFQSPTDYSKGYRMKIPDLLAFKNIAQLLVWKGEHAQLKGGKTEALEDYLNAVRLGRTLSRDRTLIGRMIEVGVLKIGLMALVRTFSESQQAPEELEHILKELMKLHAGGGGFYEIMECEYQCGFAYIVADMVEGKLDPDDGFSSGPGLLWQIRYSKYIYNYRSDIEKYLKVLDIYRKVDTTNYYSMPLEVKDNKVLEEAIGISRESNSLANMCIPNLSNSVKVVVETEVLWRGAIALAAIRLFEAKTGRLPKDLSELGELVPVELLVDPFSGKDLIYRLEGEDFYLYSVGYNGVDYQGTGDSPIYEKDTYPGSVADIIFHAPAPAKKKQD